MVVNVNPETDRIREIYSGDRFKVADRDDWSGPYHPRNEQGLGLYGRMAGDRALVAVLNDAGVKLSGRRILDLGCGAGYHLRSLVELGATPSLCHGLDLMADRVELARAFNPAMTFLEGDATDTGLDGPFDVVCQFDALCNLHGDHARQAFADEMLRLVAPGGVVVWHDIAVQQPGAETRAVPPAEVRSLLGTEPVAERWLFHRRTEQLVSYGMWWLADAVDAIAPRRLVPRTNYLAVFRP